MKIIKPNVEFMMPVDGQAIMKHLEACARVCYKSEGRIGEGTAEKFLTRTIKVGHESVLEHASISVKFTCDRGVSHEIVRHRMASYCQESTRYCNYGHAGEIAVIKPCYLEEGSMPYICWDEACRTAEAEYLEMLARGCTPQEARAVLPNSLKTEVVMTANIREWRHFFRLRCDKAAHPQMREVAMMALKMFHAEMPVLFDDIYEEVFV